MKKLPTEGAKSFTALNSLASLLAGVFLSCDAHATILVNGSFEQGWTGWNHSGVTLIHSNPAFVADGLKTAYFNDGDKTPDGVISQHFATVLGVGYTLTFVYSVYDPNTPLNEQSMVVRVAGAAELLNETATVVGGWPVPFTDFSYSFIADSTTATLSFTDNATHAQGLSADAMVDGVSITAVPEPHQYAVTAGLGLLAWSFGRRRGSSMSTTRTSFPHR